LLISNFVYEAVTSVCIDLKLRCSAPEEWRNMKETTEEEYFDIEKMNT
jgi:hypothetical protein